EHGWSFDLHPDRRWGHLGLLLGPVLHAADGQTALPAAGALDGPAAGAAHGEIVPPAAADASRRGGRDRGKRGRRGRRGRGAGLPHVSGFTDARRQRRCTARQLHRQPRRLWSPSGPAVHHRSCWPGLFLLRYKMLADVQYISQSHGMGRVQKGASV
ncbi:unnamed protein product, partial [Effrenium voratum]